MADEAGRIKLGIYLDSDPATKQAQGLGEQFQNIGKKLSNALFMGLSVKAITGFSKKCIEAASDLAEVENVTSTVFPNMTAQLNNFAKNAATAAGQSELQSKQYIGTFGAMAKAFGYNEKQAYAMSTTLSQLTGDVASFYNLSQDEAYDKLKSVFTGETESLKSLGVVMTQSALDEYAMANGFGKVTANMSEAEKVALRYSFVQDKLSAASGDFVKTQDSWANQVKILQLNLQSIMATIGNGLIAALKPAIIALNNFLTMVNRVLNSVGKFLSSIFGIKSATTEASSKLGSLGSAAKTATGGLSGLGSAAGKALGGIANTAADAVKGVSGVGNATGKSAKKAEKAVKSLKRTLEGFDQITKVDDKSGSSSGSGSGSGGGKGSGAGTGGTGSGAGTGAGTGGAGTGALGDVGTVDMSGLSDAADKSEKFGKKFDKLRESLLHLKESFSGFTSRIADGLKWILDNILKPLAEWTITEAMPRFFETLADVFDVLNAVLDALQPLWQWFWDNVLKPIAEWTAGAFISIWDGINNVLSKFADWCRENPGVIQNIAIVIGSFFAAFEAVKFVKNIVSVVSGIGKFITSVGGIGGAISKVIATLGGPWTIAIAAAIAAGILLYKNWDKIKPYAEALGKVIKKVVDTIVKLFKGVKQKLEKFVKVVKGAFDKIGKAVSSVIKFVKDVVGWFKKLPGKVKTTLTLVKGALFDTIRNAWDKFKDSKAAKTLSLLKDTAFKASKAAWEAIKDGNVKKALEIIKAAGFAAAKTAWEAIKDTKVGKTISLIKEGWDNVAGWVKKNLGGTVEKGISLAKSAWDNVANWVKKNLGGTVEKGISLAKSAWDNVANWVKKYLGGGVSKGIGLAKSSWDTVAKWVKDRMGGTVEKGISLAKSGWDTVAKWVKDRLGTGVSKGISLAKSGWDTVAKWVKDRLGDGVSKAIGLTKSWGKGVSTVADWVKKSIGGTVSVGVSLVKSGWSSIKKFFGLKSGGTVFRGGIKMFAGGTSNAAADHGTMFLAGEHGSEVVGNVGGKTEVLNRSQIATAISTGVTKAIIGSSKFNMNEVTPHLAIIESSVTEQTAQIAKLSQMAGEAAGGGTNAEILRVLREILRFLETHDWDVKLDGKSVKDRIVTLINQNTQATGKCEVVV